MEAHVKALHELDNGLTIYRPDLDLVYDRDEEVKAESYLEEGSHLIIDPEQIEQARRLTAEVYLAKGYITEDHVGENGTIMAEHDTYIGHSDYYVTTNEDGQIVATTRKIRYDRSKGRDSFPVFAQRSKLNSGWASHIQHHVGLENCVEISALAKDRALDTDKLASLRTYKKLIQDAYLDRHDGSSEKLFLMAASPKLYSQLSALFKGGIKQIGPELQYPGEEVIPAIFRPVESIVSTIKSANDPENPDAEMNRFVVDFVLEGLKEEQIPQPIKDTLAETGLWANNEKLNHADETEAKSQILNKKTLITAAILGGAAASLVFQQSPGNEAFRTFLALESLETSQDPVVAGATVGGATMVIEGGTSIFIALALHQKDSFVGKILNSRRAKKMSENEETLNDKERSLANKTADVGIALGVGPGIVVAKRHLEDKENVSLRKDIQRGLGYSALGATVSAAAGYLVAGGIKNASEVGLERPAEYFVDYATDWKFWAVAIASVYGLGWIKRKFSKDNKNA